MSADLWDLKNAVQEALIKRLEGIPNVVLPSAYVVGNDQFAKLTIGFLGWSPSLHAIKIERVVHVKMVDSQNSPRARGDLIQECLQGMDEVEAIQCERAEAAKSLGADGPLDLREISHLQADHAWPTLKKASDGDPHKSYTEALRRAHTESTTGRRNHRGSGVHVIEGRDKDTGCIIRAVLPHLRIKDANGRRAITWRGCDFEIHSPPPVETILAAMPGRRLGDFISLHPLLDERLIEGVREGRKTRSSFIVRTTLQTDSVYELIPDRE